MKAWVLAMIVSALLGGAAFFIFSTSSSPSLSSLFRSSSSSSSASSSASAQNPILVSVGGHNIHRDEVDFEQHFALFMRQKQAPSDIPIITETALASASSPENFANFRSFILKNIIHRKLLLAMVQKDKRFDLTRLDIYRQCRAEYVRTIKENPGFFTKYTDYKKKVEHRLCESYVVDRYIQTVLFDSIQISVPEMQQYYEAHRTEFMMDRRLLVRHIHLPDERQARKVRRKLTRHNFARMAKKYSIATEAAEGGLLGPFAAHEMPSFFADVFRLKVNRVSAIIKSSYGYHIFLPLKVFPQSTQSFQEAQQEIEKRLQLGKKNELYLRWFHLALNSIAIKAQSYGPSLRESVSYFNPHFNIEDAPHVDTQPSAVSADTPP